MKKNLRRHLGQLIVLFLFCSFFYCFPDSTWAEVEWTVLQTLALDEKPLDVTPSADGTKVFVLGSKNILIYSTERGAVVDKIPIKENYSQISVSPDGEHLYLTDSKANKISIIEVSTRYDIEIGQSPVIGPKNALVHAFIFLDYQ